MTLMKIDIMLTRLGKNCIIVFAVLKCTLVFKWPEEQLATVSYKMFYDHLLNFAFGSKEDQENFEALYDTWHNADLGVKDYIEDTNGVWSQANEYLLQATESGLSKDEATKLAISMAFGIDGPWTDNAYQKYYFAWYNSITLEQVDGDITINKVDENGDVITDPATFNLYYYSVEIDEDGEETVTYYYAVDENGNSYFTTDADKAAAIVTENGSCTIRYLLPDYQYYLKEIVAPNGYDLNSKEIAITVSSGENTVITITNSKTPEPDPEPSEPEPTVPGSEPVEPEPEPTEPESTSPTSSSNTDVPKTGDSSHIAFFVATGIISLFFIVALALIYYKERKI